MGKPPCYDKMGMKKGPWTPKEDEKLLAYIQEHGHESWRTLPSKAGLKRCGKSCRLRWTNYLRPDIKRGKFSLQEEQNIIQLHALLGNRWSAMANHLPKRTDNEIKNYWNTHLKKKLTKMGIDPITHKPKNHALGCGQTKDFANLCHAAQWESARLEAEARLVRESKLIKPYHLHHPAATTTIGAPPPPPRPCLDILQVWVRTNPGKDILNGFFTSSGTLGSQTSALNFSHDINYAEMSKTTSAGQPDLNYHQDEVKGIMENSMELHDIINPIDSTHAANSLGFPNFMEGFTDLPPSIVSNVVEACWNVLEDDDVNHWGNP